MENADHVTLSRQNAYQVVVPRRKPFITSFLSNLKEIFFPDDPLRQFKNQPWSKKVTLGLTYIFPILEWLPYYNFQSFRSDFISGISIASVAVPQGISYAKLANLPAIVGLYSTLVPALVYVIMGNSRHVAVGTVAVSSSLVMASMLVNVVNPIENPQVYSQLVYTATLIAGLMQAGMGFLRLGFLLDFLSHSTITGSISGAATIVILQQFKGLLGLEQFTNKSDIVSVTRSVFTQTRNWNWKTLGTGCFFLAYLLLSKWFSKRKPKYFWVSAMAPITSVILATLAVYFTQADIQIIGILQNGLNPISVSDLMFKSPYMSKIITTGLFTGFLSLTDGISVARNFAMSNNYQIDGNKEMIAIGMMNIVGSCTSCYVATGVLSRTAVNSAAGCKTAFSNLVMAVTIMIILLFLTPLFHYTPLVVLSAIIDSAMISMIDYNTAICLYKQDKFDFIICMSAYIGVVFVSVEIGLGVSVTLSVIRALLSTARPKTSVLGNIPNSLMYRDVAQHPNANTVPGVLIIHINGPIYFANSGYLRERIARWIVEEEGKLNSGKCSLQYVILDMGAVSSIDASGISMMIEINRKLDEKGITLVLANPGSEVIKKLDQSNFIEDIGRDWIYLTVAEAVSACNFKLHQAEPAMYNNM